MSGVLERMMKVTDSLLDALDVVGIRQMQDRSRYEYPSWAVTPPRKVRRKWSNRNNSSIGNLFLWHRFSLWLTNDWDKERYVINT